MSVRLLTAAGAAMLFAAPSFADPPKPPDRFTLSMTPQQMGAIMQGLQELPFKTAAPLLQDINSQIQAQLPKPAEPPAQPAPPKPPGVVKGK